MSAETSFTYRLLSHFAPEIRQRGEAYYKANAVLDLCGGTAFAEASVEGTQLYGVHIDFAGETLACHCDCAYFEKWDQCKHLWAVILAAEKEGYLSSVRSAPKLRVIRIDEDPALDEDEVDAPTHPPPNSIAGWLLRQLKIHKPHAPAQPPTWQTLLNQIQNNTAIVSPTKSIQKPRQISYQFIGKPTDSASSLTIAVRSSTPTKKGWSKPKRTQICSLATDDITDETDREIIRTLKGCLLDQNSRFGYTHGNYYNISGTEFELTAGHAATLLPRICATGRATFLSEQDDDEVGPLIYTAGTPFRLEIDTTESESGKTLHLAGMLCREGERRPLNEPLFVSRSGWIFWKDATVTPFQSDANYAWVSTLTRQGTIKVPAKDADKLLTQLFGMKATPTLHLPASLRIEHIEVPPQPCLRIRAQRHPSVRAHGHNRDEMLASLSFFYADVEFHETQTGSSFDARSRKHIARNGPMEQELARNLLEAGAQPIAYNNPYVNGNANWTLPVRKLPAILSTLLQNKWRIESEGKLYRSPSDIRVNLTSGIDWFDLNGTARFDDQEVPLPTLLAALRKGERMISLGDGSLGMLPQEWLTKYGPLAGLGESKDNTIRFSRKQAGILDAFLAVRPEMTCDETFARIRQELRSFESVSPMAPAAGFTGTLRPYQQEGLGWLHFLQRFGIGGCLADDMGLGKTVQVLALLESRRELRTRPEGANIGPTLVVVPRSLMFNWMQEAGRFTPALRILEHSGTARDRQNTGQLQAFDLILTTYGTLRRDIVHLKEITFDYVILDEAQAVKNANTDSAKAVRLLQARHRLAMSGTPVENHVGELWSLFDFLNPGMLGAASVFRQFSANRTTGDETVPILARALRPYILRRTKSQVAKDLPARTEETIYCELDEDQRQLYNELRDYYRDNLMARIARDGIKKAGIHVLEALLRLRQAACHPGLLDKNKALLPSAKLDTLLPQIEEVIEEDHKVLIFSQFTSLLAIVRARLDKAGTPYAYLDGKTTDRQACVDRFQTDPACKLFLISLKAGGLGLNLTAAEYVYLLDPWWNPAVEAQAIDRTHRIGQTRPVFAYRLIARDTVEERVLELQKTKRDLADALISEANSTLRSLTREDVELLLT